MIRKIIAETGAQVEVEDDGSVNISSITAESVETAVARIEALIKEVQAGEIYDGEVKRIQPFGAFVEILPGKDGLVHVSDMSEDFVRDPSDVVKIGDKIKVRVKEIDDLGRINLSMRLEPGHDKERSNRREMTGGSNAFSGGGRRFENRGPRQRSRFGDRRGFSGPHFPTSRFLDQKKKDFQR
jgi:polyribonucleotide nucleotidyltransferase